MKKNLSLAILVGLMSVTLSSYAEPTNCDCDCHKFRRSYTSTQSSSGVTTLPAKNPQPVTIGQPSTSTSGVTTLPAVNPRPVNIAQPSTSSGTQYTKTNAQTATQAASQTAQTKVHFGKSVSDQEGNLVVNRVGKKMMKANGINKNIYFVYSTDATVNAYTEMNGTVTVFKGVMECCENEDELAFVIGHEMGHADGYHVIKSTVVGSGLNYGAEQARGALGKVIPSRLNQLGLGNVSDMAVNAAENLGNATYSKTHENDADLSAVDYVVKAGYNPLAGISILSKIGEAYPDLFSDHPSTDKRVLNIYNYVKAKYPRYISQGYNTAEYKQAYELYIKH